MPEHMYRFRPVKKLLDVNDGELEGQYIYFASPEQLNDPLEGFKDVYFCGDQIVWKNLIKHYLRCLIHSCYDFVVAGKNGPIIRNANVFASETSDSKAMNELNRAALEKLTSEACINDYISKISSYRKVKRWELLAYIQILHFYFLDTIFECFYTYRILKTPSKLFTFDRDEVLEHIKSLSSQINTTAHLTEEEEKDFLLSYQRNSERLLLTRYRTAVKGKERLFFLLFEYPEIFCRDIESLMYPRWYTACFMSLDSCSDSSIWGSYGGNHQDVCLKFNTEQHQGRDALTLTTPKFDIKKGIIWEPTFFAFHDISYDKNFVEVDFFRSLGHLAGAELSRTWFEGENGERSVCAEDMYSGENAWHKNHWKNFYHSVTVKLKVWDREKESRLIHMSTHMNLEDNQLRKLRYDFRSLEGIIFGINTTMADKIKIMEKIESLCTKHKRQEFSFYQARYDDKSRGIVHDKLNSIQIGYTEPVP